MRQQAANKELQGVLAAYDTAGVGAYAEDTLRAACGHIPLALFQNAVREAVGAGEIAWVCDGVIGRTGIRHMSRAIGPWSPS